MVHKLKIVFYSFTLLLCISCQKETKSRFEKTQKEINKAMFKKKYVSIDSVVVSSENSGTVEKELKTKEQKKVNRKPTFDFYRTMDKDLQVFEINVLRDSVLIGKEGTKITIPARSFVLSSDSLFYPERVTLRMKEYYKIEDIISANLTTKSNEAILETAGMLYLEVFYEDKECRLDDHSTILIELPTEKSFEKSMKLFRGERYECEKINWILDKKMDENLDEKSGEIIKCSFPGGQDSLARFINRNFVYPEELLGNNIRGKVTILLGIDKEGRILTVETKNASHPLIAKEILKLIDKFPRFIPSKLNGKKISSQFLFDLFFKINDSNDKNFSTRAVKYSYNSTVNNVLKKIYQVNHLKWINIDKFVDFEGKKGGFFVRFEENEQTVTDFKLIFHEIRSVVSGIKKDEEKSVVFANIPYGKKVTLIGIRAFKNGTFALATHSCIATDTVISSLKFKTCTSSDLKKNLSSLHSIFNIN